jgi:plastocyanin
MVTYRDYFKAAIVMVTLGLAILALGNVSHAQEGSNVTIQTNVTTGAGTTSNGEIKASIVPGASTMGNNAFSPNPININVGNTVTWTNKDNTFHTVTSGTGPDDTNKGKVFDSGLSGPNALTTTGKTFSHTFATAGEFPYFCQLHPTMVGKIVVSK